MGQGNPACRVGLLNLFFKLRFRYRSAAESEKVTGIMPPALTKIVILLFYSDGLKERIAKDKSDILNGVQNSGNAVKFREQRLELMQLKKVEEVNFVNRNKLSNGLGDSLIGLIMGDDGKRGGTPFQGVYKSANTAKTKSELVRKMNNLSLFTVHENSSIYLKQVLESCIG